MLGGLHQHKEEVGYGSCVALEEESTTLAVFLPELEPESHPAQVHEQLTGNRGCVILEIVPEGQLPLEAGQSVYRAKIAPVLQD